MQQHLFPTGQQVLLAISGGIDSVVLAHLMHSAGYPFAIAHCNFNLRPGDCDRDERFVRALSERYQVPFHLARFDTAEYAHEHKLCIEDAARQLRYDYFEALRIQYGYAAILTAHHRDDAAETFFINLLRGTGLAGLHGILPVQGHIVRPLLPFGRDEIEAYAREQGLSHVEDTTNASLDYRRNQVRHQVLPLLRQLQPSADRAMQQTIQHLQSVEQLYQALLQPLRKRLLIPREDGSILVRLSVSGSLGIPAENLPQLLFELLRPFGFNMADISDMLSSSHSGRRFLSATHEAVLDRDSLILVSRGMTEESSAVPDFSMRFSPHNPVEFNPRSLPQDTAVFDADTVVLPLRLRHWREGDRFQPLGMVHGTQLVSDYFSDHKFSLIDKQCQLLLVDATDAVIWIVGRRTDHPHRVTPHTQRLLTVEIDR